MSARSKTPSLPVDLTVPMKMIQLEIGPITELGEVYMARSIYKHLMFSPPNCGFVSISNCVRTKTLWLSDVFEARVREQILNV